MAKKKAKKGDKVRVHYTCRLANGTVIDSSHGNDPLQFDLGKEEVLKGLDEAVKGMKEGEEKTCTVNAEKAYGIRHEEWKLDVPRNKFSEEWTPEVGLHFEIEREDGQRSVATVTNVSKETVTLDFNHPLAGKELVFEVSLIEISR